MPYTWFKKYFVFLTFLLNINLAKAQLGKEAWHWQFGDSCALDFSSGVPVASKSSINTNEGSASISDPNTGQLLFYTDGTKAWDRNNNQMPNGFGMIGGQGTSTQAALIVPKPGNSTIYYLISADQGGYLGTNTGVHYSIVDMSLNGGLGDITTKNTLLTPPPTTEKLTAVRHCNGVDYWIIDHPFNSNTFNVYLLTSAGINPTPVVSNVGTVQTNISGTYNETIGYMKASPNGRKLVCAVGYMHFIELFDFDNSTGIITNPVKITYFLPNYGAYGVAFSPDNSKLYVTLESIGLWQFDLSSNNSTTIINSQTTIYATNGNGFVGTIQLATDDKIYISIWDSLYLAAINNPNNIGSACNFQPHALALPTGAKSKGGLPNFIDANNPYRSQAFYTSLCSFPSYNLIANAGNNYQWYNADTIQSTIINTFGDYWVSYVNPQGCKEIDTFHIVQAQAPIINILHDTSQCNNLVAPVTLNATDTNVVSYLWNDGFTSPIHTITTAGNYWVNYTFNNFCVSRDSFTYFLNNTPIINLGNDTTFCLGDLTLNAFNSSSYYLWSTGQTTSNITVTSPNTYSVKVTNQYGCINSDTLIVHPELSAFNFVLPNIVTPNNDGINEFIDFGKYQFSSLQLDIYNRWGVKVFESNNSACIWKPTEDDGTYYYIIQYIINCGTETQNKNLKGFITIAR